MFKKLLPLAAVAALGLSANAEVVQDYMIDYRTTTWNFYVMGYIPSQENGWLTVTQTRGSWERVDGEAVYTPNEDKDEDGLPDVSWYQLFVADGIPTNIAQDYTVTVYGKADVDGASSNMNMQWGWGEGQQLGGTFTFSTDWEEISVTYPEIGGSSCALVFQPGTQETTFEIQWIKVSHNDTSKPVEWINLLTNGDAEGEYGEMPCAYSKEYGYNDNEPHPAFIEEVDGGHAFVCHATEKFDQPWDNQFWIVAPQTFKKGDSFRVLFDAKAAKAGASVATQQHAAPGAYQHWAALGNISFSTDWEEKGGTLNAVEQDGMYSIALNLNDFEDANDYYFDNMRWEIMKLDEGYFVAGDFNDKDLDNAYELIENEDGYMFAVMGTEDKLAGQFKLSTKRGNDNAFNAACLKIDDTKITGDEEFFDFEQDADGNILIGTKWVGLPWPGIWTILVDTEYDQLAVYEASDEEIEAWNGHDGINVIANDNAAPVYYNLQGVRVANPVSGQVYIVKKGSKAFKAIIL